MSNAGNANELWMPGGKTPAGYSEVVVDQIPKGKYIENPIKQDIMDKIIDKKWDYTLYKRGDELILSAVCGSVGVFEINVILTSSEVEEYKQNGTKYIETLARKIQRTPSFYKSRHIEI